MKNSTSDIYKLTVMKRADSLQKTIVAENSTLVTTRKTNTPSKSTVTNISSAEFYEEIKSGKQFSANLWFELRTISNLSNAVCELNKIISLAEIYKGPIHFYSKCWDLNKFADFMTAVFTSSVELESKNTKSATFVVDPSRARSMHNKFARNLGFPLHTQVRTGLGSRK